MPRYLVEHDFSQVSDSRAGIGIGRGGQVTWLRVYMSADRSKGFCVYDAPSADAIRELASLNNLPVHQITEVETMSWDPRWAP
ncbi:MAG TPA: nickel-binding protein [Gammaproteobacteria bacterium]